MRKKEVFKNAIFGLLNQIFIIARGFIIPRLIISTYGSNVNGLVSSITNFLAFITLLDGGFNVVIKSLLYKPIVNKDKKQIESILYSSNRFFRRIAGIFIIYIVLLLIIYPQITGDFNCKFIDLLIIVISISTFFEYYFGISYRIFLEASGKSYLISIINSLVTIISTIVITFLVKYNYDIIIVKLFGSIIFIIKPILLNVYARKKYKLCINSNYKEYVIQNKWDGLAQHIAWVIYCNTDVAVLTLFSTLFNVSIYSVYSLVCVSLRSIVNAITSGIDSTFGNIIASGKKELLEKGFDIYEIIYFSIITILFSCAIILIIPFVKVYTLGINDTNYINSSFGIIIILSEYIIAIRRPYRALIHAKGHFKETRIGAWIECIINITLSVVLVFKYGLVGIAIGTLAASLVRTIEFIYHANKVILSRKNIISIKKIILVIISTIFIILLDKYISYVDNINYINFLINSVITILFTTMIVLIVNIIFYNTKILKVLNIKNVIKQE